MAINRDLFFPEIRSTVFRGVLSQPQVDGLNTILDGWEVWTPAQRIEDLAYELATTYHECAATMQPISEWGHGAGRPYGHPDPVTRQVYYARGYVGLTWKANYVLMSKVTGEDLVNHPEIANEPAVAAKIMFYGMAEKSFTGMGLSDFPTGPGLNFYQWRRIINGLDCAQAIATYANEFLVALTKKA